jgi:peptidoglycan/LPS O-acetylase OafA/YrhL
MAGARPAPKPGTRLAALPSLTGMRWAAALMVFGFHTTTLNVITSHRAHEAWNTLTWPGLSGVSFFFVLSGLILVWSARPGDTKRAFWQRRVAKVMPNHAVTWAAVVAIMLAWGDGVRPATAVANLLLVQPWVPDREVFYSINSVSWSLGCELFFYLCLPLALPVIRRMRTGWLYGLVVALPLAIYAVWPLTRGLDGWDAWWLTQIFPPVRSLEFWLGVAAGELFIRRRWRGPGLWPATAIFIGIYAANNWIPTQYWPADLTVGYLLLITAAAKADVTGAWSPWRNRVMVWLGEISFAFYLVHVVVIANVMRLMGHGNHGWPSKKAAVAMLFFLVVSVGLAWLLYRFVEMPMMRVLRPRRRAAPAEPASVQPDPHRPRGGHGCLQDRQPGVGYVQEAPGAKRHQRRQSGVGEHLVDQAPVSPGDERAQQAGLGDQ